MDIPSLIRWFFSHLRHVVLVAEGKVKMRLEAGNGEDLSIRAVSMGSGKWEVGVDHAFCFSIYWGPGSINYCLPSTVLKE